MALCFQNISPQKLKSRILDFGFYGLMWPEAAIYCTFRLAKLEN